MADEKTKPEESENDIWDSVEEIAKRIIRVIIRIIKRDKEKPS